jgi:hypothetical protein
VQAKELHHTRGETFARGYDGPLADVRPEIQAGEIGKHDL